MKIKTWMVLLAVIVCAVAIAAALSALSPRVRLEVAKAKRGPIQEFVDERGKTRLPETYLITMPQNGRIEPITLIEGARVNKGQIVSRIVQRDLDLSVAESQAVVERLDAAIRENAESNVEQTAYQQALQFVKSMIETVKAAAARVESGKAKHVYAEKTLGRTQRLFQTKTRTQEELDQAQLDEVQSRIDVQQDELVYAAMQAMEAATNLMPTMIQQYIGNKGLKEAVLMKQRAEAVAQLEQILQEQKRGNMTSPVDGVVLAREISNERFLSAGTVLLEIGRLEDLEVESEVLSLDVVQVKVGDPVEIYGPAVGVPPARGTVARIYPAGFTKISSLGVEQQRVIVVVHFKPEDLKRLVDERHLGVGYQVRVKIFTAQKADALVIPRSALLRGSGGNWQVFAVRNGLTKIQDVKVGLLNDEAAEILDGLREGDLVVLAPQTSLVDGVRVDTLLVE